MRPGRILILASGWFLLAASTFAQVEYTADGTPTALEEEIRWLMNRARFDTARENLTRQTSYTDVPDNAPPVAVHQALTVASRHHSEDMARQNLFQHATIPGSGYYNATSQPQPWDRMRAEGYAWNQAAENIAAGYSSAEIAYIGWWNSSGHRVNLCKAALREVGTGYFNLSGSKFGRYYTMDLGSSGSTRFFTDTVFRDTNGNGKYDQGEGVGGIRLKLRSNGVVHGHCDVSSSVGSFAVPTQTITEGSLVEVLLSNITLSTLVCHIPRTYSSNAVVTLAAGEELVVGTFYQPSGTRNVGFRNLAPSNRPKLILTDAPPSITLRWPTQAGLRYRLQWTSDFSTWTDLGSNDLTGTGGELLITETALPIGRGRRFYRVSASGP